MVTGMLLAWLCFFLATRTSGTVCLCLLSARLLSTLALATLATFGASRTFRALVTFGAICTLSPVRACVSTALAIATSCRLSPTLALLLPGLLSSGLLLGLCLRLLRRLLVARFYLGTIGVDRCWFLPALLPISALAL